MAGEIASAYLSIYPKLEAKNVADEIGKSMGGAGKSAGKAFSSSASGAMQSGMGGAGSAGASALANGFSVAKVALGNIIADVAKSAADEFKERFSDGIEQSDALQKFGSTMKFAGFDTAQIDSVRTAMKDYADQTVYDLGEVMDTTAKLAANGVQDYDTLVQAAGNLNAAAGGNSESFGYFANAITQVNGAGKLMSQDWNQIVNALPGASGAIQNELKEMGAWDDSMGTFKDALAAGEVTADEFNTALSNLGMTDVAKEAATSTTTFEGAMGQLDASVTNTMQGIYDSLNEDGRVTDAINSMASAFEEVSPTVSDLAGAFGDFIQSGIETLAPIVTTLADAFGQLLNFIQPALPVIAGIIAGIAGASVITTIIGAISTAIGIFTTVILPAISAITTVPALIAAVVGVLGGPITIIGAIIGAIVAFIATNEDMRNKVMEVFGVVKNTVLGALNTVLNIVNSVWPAISAIIGTVLGVIKSSVETNFSIIKTIITTAMNVVRSIVAAVSAAMQGNWSGALSAMKSAVSSAISGIRSIFGTLRGAVMGALSGIGSWLVGAGQDLISGFVNGISGAVGWVTNAVSNLCSNALGTLKSFFGIKSPSRLMKEMGGYLMQGLAIGIEDGTVQATRAMGSASETIANALGLDGHSVGAAYGVATMDPKGASQVTQNITNNVYEREDAYVAATIFTRSIMAGA